MKKLGIGCAAFLAAIAIFVGVIFWATSGVTGVADEFVEHLAAGENDQAYALLGPSAVEDMPRERFDGWLKASKFDQAQSGFWSSRNVENNKGEVSGTVTLTDGSEQPVTFILGKVGGDWKIQGIQLEEGGVDSPEASGAEAGVRAAAELFLQRVKSGEMKEAYAMVGDSLKADLKEEAFAPFLKESGVTSTQSADWGKVGLKDSVGEIKGRLAISDNKHVDLTLIMVESNGEWLIQGLNIKPVEGLTELPAPTDEEALALAAEVQKALATYVDTQDDSKLMQLCHATLRYQLKDEEKGLPAFVKSFPDQKSFRETLDLQPELVEKPVKDQKYGATIRTKTAALPNGVFLAMNLRLGVENEKWVLTSFEVNTRKP